MAMQFPKGSGLEYLDKVIRRSLDYYSETFRAVNFRLPEIFNFSKGPSVIKLPSLDTLRRPVETFVSGLNNAVAQIGAKPEKVDYKAIVGTFLPPGARLLKPQYPEGSNEIQFADLDGDGRSELVTSYKTSDGIKTLVLHKDEVQWYRMAEFSNPGFDKIHYRNSADIAGDGKQYLLLGLESDMNARTLFAFSPHNGNKLFSKNYNMLELLTARGTARIPSRRAIALWNEEAPGVYNIDLVAWNGSELEKLDSTRYLAKKVIPYYIRKVNQQPDNAAAWYNLADIMAKTGNRNYAETAIKIGLGKNPDSLLREKFSTLKSRLSE